MNRESPSINDVSERIADLVDQWEVSWLAGRELSVEWLCASQPDLISQVRERIGLLKAINPLLDIKPSTLNDQAETRSDNRVRKSALPVCNVTTTSSYQILSSHARGGLGEVLVAHDANIGRKVAIKIIQTPFADDPSRQQRFLREAEITGRLEHPGIVPVHGIGKDEFGRPCYAMRFVEGQTLREAIAAHHSSSSSNVTSRERNLSLRQLLQRFISVCNTIAFANSHGVIHRDIKPSNVIVGEFGETLVVDWGLAKQLDSKDDTQSSDCDPDIAIAGNDIASTEPLTEEGRVLGTLYYMSPEQATGDANITLQTDVYSLGATLYSILTGQPPFANSGTPDNAMLPPLLERVQRGHFAHPRKQFASIPGRLEAICLRAMANKPEKRYATASDLARDIESWMADERITAFEDSWLDRGMRWARQHRLMVTTVAAATAVAFVGMVLQLATISRTNAVLQTAFVSESNAKETAVTQRNIAQQNAHLADEQSAIARSILQDVIENVQRDLRFVPASQKARRAILLKSMKGLAGVSQSIESRPAIDRMKMLAHRDLGDVYQLIGNEAGIDGTQSAHVQFQSALKAAETLATENALDRQSQIDLAAVHQRVSATLLELKSAQEAEVHLKKYLQIWEHLSLDSPNDLETQLSFASALNTFGEFHMLERSFDTAASHFERALSIIDLWIKRSPLIVGNRHESVATFNSVGKLRVRQGKQDEAISVYERSLAANRSRRMADPNDPRIVRDLAFVISAIGSVYWSQAEYAKVEPYYREALELRQQNHSIDPTNMAMERELMQSHEKLGDLMRKRNQIDVAKEHYNAMLAICNKHVTLNPGSNSALRDLSAAYERMGKVCWEGKDTQAAFVHLRGALESDRIRSAQDPTDARAKVDIAIALSSLAVKLLELDQSKEAIELLTESTSIYRNHFAANPTDAKARRGLFVLLSQLSEAQGKMKQFEQARSCNSESQQMITEVLHNDPKNVSNRLDLITALRARGVIERSAGSYMEAKEWFQKALAAVRELEAEKKLVGTDLEWRADIEQAIRSCDEKLGESVQVPEKVPDP